MASQEGLRVSPLLGPCACFGAVGTVILPARTLPCLSLHQDEAAGPVPPCPLVAVTPTYPGVSSSSDGEWGTVLCSCCLPQGSAGRRDRRPKPQVWAKPDPFLGKPSCRRWIFCLSWS